MTDASRKKPSTTASRTYKRSWKNLLINKKYQLRFTLFMVGLAGVLMAGLGYFVMFYADRTTTIGINRVISEPCPEVASSETAALVPDQPAPPDDGSGAGSGSDAGSGDRDKPTVVIEDMQTCDNPDPTKRPENCPAYVPPPPPPAPPAGVVRGIALDDVAAKWGCELRHAGAVEALHQGRTQILLVLIGTGLLLVLGLAVYGIKMTHRVAGPLYKVQLYLAKMRDGRLDKVWNLRKGDQLIEFYEHFKGGHAGVVAMEQADLTRLRAMLAVIDKDPAKFEAPELVERVAELRAIVARKEKSLE